MNFEEPNCTHTTNNFYQKLLEEDWVTRLMSVHLVNFSNTGWSRYYPGEHDRRDPKVNKRDRAVNDNSWRVNEKNKHAKRFHF